jgi:hypothetical protein
MFLIGLTGSAIPYLLFLGIVIVFSLGTNTEALNKKWMLQDQSNMHLTYTEENSSQAPEICFNYTTHHYHQTRLVDQTDCFSITTNPEPFIPLAAMKKNGFIAIHYSSAICTDYFGLSPPIMA